LFVIGIVGERFTAPIIKQHKQVIVKRNEPCVRFSLLEKRKSAQGFLLITGHKNSIARAAMGPGNGGVMSEQKASLELKYCERCGGLWLRPAGGQQIYCVICARAMSEMPRPREEECRDSGGRKKRDDFYAEATVRQDEAWL
jgi:Zn-finger nucleic acid-binding protein